MPRGKKRKIVTLLFDSSHIVNTNRPQGLQNHIAVTKEGSIARRFQNELSRNDFDIIEFEDILEKIIKTEKEASIITLRRLGYTDSAIAEKLNICQSNVTRIRHTLFKRFQRHNC